MYYKIYNTTKNVVLANKALVADNFFKRLIGFMFRKNIADDEALIFYKAPSIHMFFMRIPLTVIFLDNEFKVIKIYFNLKPWKVASCLTSSITIEFPAKKSFENLVQEGDTFKLIPYIE